jgi:hypothetical protein
VAQVPPLPNRTLQLKPFNTKAANAMIAGPMFVPADDRAADARHAPLLAPSSGTRAYFLTPHAGQPPTLSRGPLSAGSGSAASATCRFHRSTDGSYWQWDAIRLLWARSCLGALRRARDDR